MNNRLSKSFKPIISSISILIIVPFTIALIANFFTWVQTKDKYEITFQLDNWITIGNVNLGDLPNLRLLHGDNMIDNILKVSWLVTNTGNKGISYFETGPYIQFPNGLNIVAAKIDEKSSLLKVNRYATLDKNIAYIDSLGLFNRDEFFKIDFYICDANIDSITNEYFSNWNLIGKTLDLSIKKVLTKADESQTISLIQAIKFISYGVAGSSLIFSILLWVMLDLIQKKIVKKVVPTFERTLNAIIEKAEKQKESNKLKDNSNSNDSS